MVAEEFPGTRSAHYNQLHNNNLVLGENRKSAFDVLSLDHRSKILNEGGSFHEATSKHLIKNFPLENIILQCLKVLHPDSCTSDLSQRGIQTLGNEFTVISQ